MSNQLIGELLSIQEEATLEKTLPRLKQGRPEEGEGRDFKTARRPWKKIVRIGLTNPGPRLFTSGGFCVNIIFV